MNKVFGYKALALAVAGVAMNAHSAGLDRSGQDITAFLQDGTYAEAVYTYMDTDISGYDNGVAGAASAESAYVQGNATGNISEKYDFFRYGVKTDVNDRISVGVLYDEPFGASVQHAEGGASNFVSQGGDAVVANLSAGRVPTLAAGAASLSSLQAGFAGLQQIQTGLQQIQAGIAAATAANNTAQLAALQAQATALQTQATTITQQILAGTGTTSLADAQVAAQRLGAAVNAGTAAQAQQGEGTNVEIRTHGVTGLVGFKFGEKRNIQVYGGATAQHLTGEVHLRGTAYQGATGYDARISPDQAVGWVAGASYSKPEIALKAALTYRSKIEHSSQIAEVFPALGAAGTTNRDFEVTLPESYNLDFQTGVSPTMLLTAKVRYVPWSKFSINPPTYGDATARTNNGVPLSIVSYDKDQWSGEIGLGKKVSDKLSLAANVGYDSGAGSPVSSLGPVKGYYSVGGGFKYNITPNWSASLGAKYLKFGDTKAVLPNKLAVGEFNDNDGFVAGLKIAYQGK